MEFSGLILILVFFLLLILNVPISFCIGISTAVAMLFSIDFIPATTTISQRMVGGLDSFALLAIPLFVLSGLLMGRGGVARKLIDCAMALIGMLPGGLALVNVMSCTLFGSISGSAVATTSAIGSFIIPEMEKKGYDRNFATAVTACASTTGMIIPPSNILIIYAIASGGVSVSALFVAGYLPGLLLASLLMIVCAGYAIKKGFPTEARLPLSFIVKKVIAAVPSLMLIFIIIGGILGGIFTATEAGAIAVFYSLILAVLVYKEVKVGELKEILLKAGEISAIVLLLIAASSAMSWMLSYENIPEIISKTLMTISENPLIILLIINLILIIVGAFMDMTQTVLIFTPIFLPVAESLGMSPLHFGIMMVLNLSIGLCSPPVGAVLFVGCSVGNTTIDKIIKPMVPLYIAMFIALMLVTYIPAISEFLPKAFGLY
ncbi:TRAP transporter large permease [Colwellia sp. MSW7]|uniref:TRAP transporter large permease protein n=1 Tax=Colwellia maritima TaxID=2912588 RepID=A0ABS9X5M4_9GAMM|nr:TRAP transporter large permease [Colwellia maritima]MCI2285390.1 TRAP transporter large permease [Colwellia maritima]